MALLYTDEHVPLAVIKALKRAGHDVVRAVEVYPQGTDDEPHFQRAIAESRTILTQDTDFLVLSSRHLSTGGHHSGVVWCSTANAGRAR